MFWIALHMQVYCHNPWHILYYIDRLELILSVSIGICIVVYLSCKDIFKKLSFVNDAKPKLVSPNIYLENRHQLLYKIASVQSTLIYNNHSVMIVLESILTFFYRLSKCLQLASASHNSHTSHVLIHLSYMSGF